MARFVGSISAPPQSRADQLMEIGLQNIIGGLGALEQRKKDEKAEARQEEALKRQRALEQFALEQNITSQGRMVSPELSSQLSQGLASGDIGGLTSLIQSAPLTQEETARRKAVEQKFNLEQKKLNDELIKAEKENVKQTQKQIDDLRTEIQGMPVTRDLNTVASSYQRLLSAAEKRSAAGDLALVFNFMKINDPGSVVRESEFKNAAQARAWISRADETGIPIPTFVRQAIQKFETGEILTPEQRGDFVKTAGGAFQGQLNTFREATLPQRKVVQARGLPAEQIFPQYPVNIIDPQQGVAQAGQIIPQQYYQQPQAPQPQGLMNYVVPQAMAAQPQVPLMNAQSHPEANAALEWIRNFPNDPRAAEIRARLGVQ